MDAEKYKQGDCVMMIRRNIRPAEEEIGNLLPELLFTIGWYSALGSIITRNAFQTELILFLAAGLLPLFHMTTSIRRAFFYRRQRAAAIALGKVANGRIMNVTRQTVPYTSDRSSSVRYRKYYYLTVEMFDPYTGASTTIQSQAYRLPIHRYLRSDQVRVYTDQSGWKHYLEDLQWKRHRSDPDLFGPPREFEEAYSGTAWIGQIILIIILIFTILSFIF